jgi:hypothetical protein
MGTDRVWKEGAGSTREWGTRNAQQKASPGTVPVVARRQ